MSDVVLTLDEQARPVVEAVVNGTADNVVAAVAGLDDRARSRIAKPLIVMRKTWRPGTGTGTRCTSSP